MIPMLAVIKVQADRRPPVRLWIPLILVWILLAPIALVLAPIFIVVALIVGLNPFTTIWNVGRVLAALSGVNVEVESPDANVLVRIQ
ncbi:MAG TPA: hypothetical protein VFE03_05910 [Caulobacteraceae bacterium]|nr:hypothetical protein [Caulobacteraceae bacterium]